MDGYTYGSSDRSIGELVPAPEDRAARRRPRALLHQPHPSHRRQPDARPHETRPRLGRRRAAELRKCHRPIGPATNVVVMPFVNAHDTQRLANQIHTSGKNPTAPHAREPIGTSFAGYCSARRALTGRNVSRLFSSRSDVSRAACKPLIPQHRSAAVSYPQPVVSAGFQCGGASDRCLGRPPEPRHTSMLCCSCDASCCHTSQVVALAGDREQAQGGRPSGGAPPKRLRSLSRLTRAALLKRLRVAARIATGSVSISATARARGTQDTRGDP